MPKQDRDVDVVNCDFCGKPMESDDRRYELWHKDRKIVGHYPCFGEALSAWIDAGDAADAQPQTDTPRRRLIRMFQKIRLGTRAIASATAEIEKITGAR
jgi:hypothetical protein